MRYEYPTKDENYHKYHLRNHQLGKITISLSLHIASHLAS